MGHVERKDPAAAASSSCLDLREKRGLTTTMIRTRKKPGRRGALEPVVISGRLQTLSLLRVSISPCIILFEILNRVVSIDWGHEYLNMLHFLCHTFYKFIEHSTYPWEFARQWVGTSRPLRVLVLAPDQVLPSQSSPVRWSRPISFILNNSLNFPRMQLHGPGMMMIAVCWW